MFNEKTGGVSVAGPGTPSRLPTCVGVPQEDAGSSLPVEHDQLQTSAYFPCAVKCRPTSHQMLTLRNVFLGNEADDESAN